MNKIRNVKKVALLLVSIVFSSAALAADNYFSHPYFFAEYGYNMVAGKRTLETNSSFPLAVEGSSTSVNDASTMTDAKSVAIGAGINFPVLFHIHWLADNAFELSFSQFQNQSNGVRTETQTTQGITYPRTTTAYNYNISDLLVLINYVADFKPIIKDVQPFVAVGAGINRSTVSNYAQSVTSGTKQYISSDISIPNNTGFAYDAGFGLKVSLAKHLQTVFGYRFVDAADVGGGKMSGSNGNSTVTLPMPGNNNDFNEFYLRLIYQL